MGLQRSYIYSYILEHFETLDLIKHQFVKNSIMFLYIKILNIPECTMHRIGETVSPVKIIFESSKMPSLKHIDLSHLPHLANFRAIFTPIRIFQVFSKIYLDITAFFKLHFCYKVFVQIRM